MSRMIPFVTVAAAFALLGWWALSAPPVAAISARLPGTDRPAATSAGASQPTVVLPGVLEQFGGQAGSSTDSWPGFRGPSRDGLAAESVPLARTWPAEGPPVLWSVPLGEGYAAPAVHQGRVFLLDYDQQKEADALRCFSLADGREIWRRWYPVRVLRSHGMSRTIPAVTDRHVVTIGPKCHVLCVRPDSGQALWHVDLVGQFSATVPPWYAGQCPLIDQGRAILAVGGPDVLLMAVDCETGRIVWRTPNVSPRWKMTHSSVMPMELDGVRMYVYCGSGGVVAVAADDGRILWKTDAWKISIATVPSPLVLGDGRVFLTGGYNAGSLMLRLIRRGDAFAAETLFRLDAKTFSCEQHTPVLHEGRIYGVRPDGELACLDLDGRVLWTSGPEDRFGLGPFLPVGGLMFLMNDEGVLTLAEVGPGGYRRLARRKVLPGHESWAPIVPAGGRLLVRDLTRMVCLDVAAGAVASVR